MITDAELAVLAAGAYNDTKRFSWDLLWSSFTVTDTADEQVVAFRGTASPLDWLRDVGWKPILNPDLGWCHHGFAFAAAAFVSRYPLSAGRPLILTGHSLGGALATAVGGILAARRTAPAAVVTFGAPRVGMAKFVASLASVAVRQYRRGNDPVTELPFALWPLLMFRHAREPLIGIGQASPGYPLSCHRAGGYVEDLLGIA